MLFVFHTVFKVFPTHNRNIPINLPIKIVLFKVVTEININKANKGKTLTMIIMGHKLCTMLTTFNK